jgi:dihydrofolate reductase
LAQDNGLGFRYDRVINRHWRKLMRKLIVSAATTLDAAFKNPQDWSFGHMNDEVVTYATEQVLAADALIMGRDTFEVFAATWPERTGDFADRFNSFSKYVASRTLKASLAWNATLLGNIGEDVARLKQQPGQNILQYGIGELTRTLVQLGLVDEIRLQVYPIVLGSGERIFESLPKTNFNLIETKRFSTGVVALHYQL